MAAWSFMNEATFIDELGRHSLLKTSRLALLKGYRAGLLRRAQFEALNPAALLARCDANIATEKGARQRG